MSNISCLNIHLDGICIGVRTSNQKLKEGIIKSFSNSISGKNPDIVINAKIKNFSVPTDKKVLIKIRGRELGVRKGKRYILYRDNSAIAWLSRDLTKIDVFVKNAKDAIFLERIIYFILMGSLSKRKMSCLHASGVEVNGKGFLFIGPSGTGKTTIARLAATYADGMIVDDDAILLHDNGKDVNIYFNSYIYWGKEKPGTADNIFTTSISGIFFLCPGKENLATRIGLGAAIAKLIRFTTLTLLRRDEFRELVEMYMDLVKKVPCFDLKFLPDRTAWDYLTREVKLR